MGLVDPMQGPSTEGPSSSNEDMGAIEMHLRAFYKAMTNGNWSKAAQAFKSAKMACETEGYEEEEA